MAQQTATAESPSAASAPADEHPDMHHMAPTQELPIGHAAMPGMDHAMHEMSMPRAAAGMGDSVDEPMPAMPGMDMIDNRAWASLRVDELEAVHARGGDGQAWSVQGGYGGDLDKLWLRSEGSRRHGGIDDGQVELLWKHAVAPFQDSMLGLRQDIGKGAHRRWLAFGIEGLAPYGFEVEATVYAAASGRMAARLHVRQDWLLSQRWILQPDIELNLYGRDDARAHTGSGLTDTRAGLRLRYEIRREFAPYVGVAWTHRYGSAADYARQAGEPVMERQWLAGLMFWF